MPSVRAKEKTCSKCGVSKELSQFHKHLYTRDRLQSQCMDCQKATNRERYAAKTPEERKAFNRRKQLGIYGLKPEDFDALAAQQGYRCAICQEKPDELVVDHDHDTNKVRGLLCHQCNMALGKFRDNIHVLRSAVAYMRKHQ